MASLVRGALARFGLLLDLSPIRYLLVGALAFLIDFGLLWLLHQIFLVPLAISTPAAFLSSFALTFALQRSLTFNTQANIVGSVVKYSILVAFNTVATTVIVIGGVAAGFPWQFSKAGAVAVTVAWNYFGYRYWIFPMPRADDDDPGEKSSVRG